MPFLDWLLTCPLLCNARCTVHGRHGRRHPCCGAEVVSHGAVQLTTEILQLQSIDKVSMSLLCRSSKFSSADGEETVELPQLQLVAAGHCRSHARRCATTDTYGSDVRKLWRSRSCSTFERGGRCPCCAGLAGEVHRQFLTVWRLWRWEGFSAALTHFSRSSGSSMVKSSSPSRAPLAN